MAVELEGGTGRATAAGRTVSDVLDAWVAQNLATWAPSSACDRQSSVRAIQDDAIARLPLARLPVADVERWHPRLRKAGRWGWVSTNAAALAKLKSAKAAPRAAMTLDEVRAEGSSGAPDDRGSRARAADRLVTRLFDAIGQHKA